MSDKPSEYLKRTCLICGCHTNQTINIYEPRSGPNIVQLIQAKFKFQPLNEDKYLCFSCNNWLINWHSLQALNSNDADSPSGTFRPHMNSMLHEEGGGDGEKPSQQQSQQKSKQNATKHKSVIRCRPVAKVHPWQLATQAAIDDNVSPMLGAIPQSPSSLPKIIAQKPLNTSEKIATVARRSIGTTNLADTKFVVDLVVDRKLNVIENSHQLSCISRPNVNLLQLRRRNCDNQPRDLRSCCMCGKRISLQPQLRRGAGARKTNLKCRKCNIVCSYLRAMEQRKRRPAHKTQSKFVQRQQQLESVAFKDKTSNNHNHANTNTNIDIVSNRTEARRQRLQRPLVDGKVVAMLRRLGTTLSRENTCENGSSAIVTIVATRTASSSKPLPLIMSPVKAKPRWTRQLDEDEILLDFDAAISEVLPLFTNQSAPNEIGVTQQQEQQKMHSVSELKQAKRKLTYQITNEKENEQSVYPVLPQGLTISLV